VSVFVCIWGFPVTVVLIPSMVASAGIPSVGMVCPCSAAVMIACSVPVGPSTVKGVVPEVVAM
jgi:hypothetical protein